MGKKAKTKAGKVKANGRKVDKATLPDPPKPIVEEVGSKELLKEPKIPGSIYKALDREGYDDGGVGDLTLVMDLEDHILRRRRGDSNYFAALKADLLPRDTTGQLQNVPRRDQKLRLARLLFSDDDEDDENPSSEVYMENADGLEDEATLKTREDGLASAKYALRISTVLREAACSSLSLSEICKRRLALRGKAGAEDALRCAEKAIEIASDGFYDNEDITREAADYVKIDPKFEKNATYPGLTHPATLKDHPVRVAELCFRSAYLQKGCALLALGRYGDARESWSKVLPMLVDEPRCGRVDWERCSIILNIGNSYSREGDLEKASEFYAQAEKLGQDHLDVENGNKVAGLGIVQEAMRVRSFALKRANKEEEAKTLLRKVLELQIQKDAAEKEQKAIEAKMLADLEEAEKEQDAAGQ